MIRSQHRCEVQIRTERQHRIEELPQATRSRMFASHAHQRTAAPRRKREPSFARAEWRACRSASSCSTTTRSFGAGCASCSSRKTDLEIVGEAGTAEEALGRIPPTHPDVALLDVRLPDGDGVEVCRDIRSAHPEIQCLMLTSFADDEALLSAIMAGASGYLLKQVKGTDLVDAIRRVAAEHHCSTRR